MHIVFVFVVRDTDCFLYLMDCGLSVRIVFGNLVSATLMVVCAYCFQYLLPATLTIACVH